MLDWERSFMPTVNTKQVYTHAQADLNRNLFLQMCFLAHFSSPEP